MTTTSFDDRDGLIWLDGDMVEWRGARLHVLSHGLHYGTTVFEGERVYAGTVFELERHTLRLFASARLIGFDIPYSVEDIMVATEAVVAAADLDRGYVRPVAWLGSERMGIAGVGASVRVAIAAWHWAPFFPPDALVGGIRLDIARWARPSPKMVPTQAKASGLYMISTLALTEARRAGYDDALLLDERGDVAEATGANVFFVEADRLVTPPSTYVLDGITRQTVMRLARGLGIEVVERAIAPDELSPDHEVFLTGTAYEIQPVAEIAGVRFRVGPVTRVLDEAFQAEVGARRAVARAALS